MKKMLLTIALLAISIVAFSQKYGEFSLPHTTSIEVLNQYIGQRVKVPYNHSRDKDKYDEDFFDLYYGDINSVYTIKKFKVNSEFITIFLYDSLWNVERKVKVNINGAHNRKGMSSCESFFLVDKHEKYKKEHQKQMVGYKFFDKLGKEVAQITQVEFVDRYYPHFPPKAEYTISPILQETSFKCIDIEKAKNVFGAIGEVFLNENKDTIAIIESLKSWKWEELIYSFRNKYDESVCDYSIENFSNLLPKVGEVLTHPRVKHTYKIVGISNENEYIVVNTTTNQKKTGTETNVFSSDLAGRYVSILSKVEKPSNPSIRYGKTKVIEKNAGLTQYSYIDNVIDMLIVGNSENFSFVLKNISDNSIKVIWNEAAFVDFDGSTSKVMHSGIKYSQREEDQPATTIIKGAKIEDVAVPTCNVRYSSVLKEWVEDSMYPSMPDEKPGQLRLMLPIQIKDVVNEYVFVFDVKYVYNHPEVLVY